MDQTSHSQRTALVTGAAGVLGTAITGALLRDGFRVALLDIDRERLARVRAPGAPVLELRCDVTDEAQVEAAVARVLEAWGAADVLVNNAGVEPHDSIDKLDVANWDRAFALNVRAPMLLVKHLAPHWRVSGGGAVINIGSRTWLSGSSGVAYGSSKAALVGLTRAVAVELGPHGVTANVIAPSYVPSGLNASYGDAAYREELAARFAQASALRRLISPDDVAAAVVFLASSGARNITGEVLNVAAGSHFPPTVR